MGRSATGLRFRLRKSVAFVCRATIASPWDLWSLKGRVRLGIIAWVAALRHLLPKASLGDTWGLWLGMQFAKQLDMALPCLWLRASKQKIYWLICHMLAMCVRLAISVQPGAQRPCDAQLALTLGHTETQIPPTASLASPDSRVLNLASMQLALHVPRDSIVQWAPEAQSLLVQRVHFVPKARLLPSLALLEPSLTSRSGLIAMNVQQDSIAREALLFLWTALLDSTARLAHPITLSSGVRKAHFRMHRGCRAPANACRARLVSIAPPRP